MPSYHFQKIEPKWQKYWDDHKTFRALDCDPQRQKLYVLDMFPYPSGAGLHVGHPEGYTATDIYCRFQRMKGLNVLHPMGWDAFGLPAEQYAVENNVHPAITTRKNIDTFRRQIKALGFSYDWDREISTTDPDYYKWTQWIFLQIHDTWYDPDFQWIDPQGKARKGKGRPIAELPIPAGVDADTYRDSKRLAYRAEVPVNWCPALGTVLANEEVIDGKSERGNHPVVRMPLKQWMLRITAYADRLVEDLDGLDWSKAIKDMQRNWVGRSEGAEVIFPIDNGAGQAFSTVRNGAGPLPVAETEAIQVYTTRPDTLFGATYMVLAPEHPLVDRITQPDRAKAVADYREQASRKSDLDRTDLAKTKTGVFTGGHAINPVNRLKIPIWIADYVLMGYGTGAIMAVPGHDERDFEFAKTFDLPIIRVVAKDAADAGKPLDEAESEYGVAVNSSNAEISLDGLPTDQAKSKITQWLFERWMGRKAVNFKLRDWLFSRQRYWGEPFPVVIDENDCVRAVPESELPVLLPDLDDFKPSGKPEPPLGKATAWVNYSEKARRETNTMPQWAGSCWYYIRFIDPRNHERPWDADKANYWLPVDLYIGGAEHAVLHLLYSRFWHKVLFDRGLLNTPEPFQKLVNQGMILGETEYTAFRDEDGRYVHVGKVEEVEGHFREKKSGTALHPFKVGDDQVVKQEDGFVLVEDPTVRVDARAHKMSKSRGNVINPDEVISEYGADSLRLYEMFMGPLEAVKPWSMKGVEGVYRFLGRAWRLIVDEKAEEMRLDPKVRDVEPTVEQAKIVARTIAGVEADCQGLRFNTAISKLMEFVNFFTAQEVRPKSSMEAFTLILAPFSPHVAEELWEALGHPESLALHPWPTYDPALLKDDAIEIPVQINGKVRGRVTVPAEATNDQIESAAKADPRIAELLGGKAIRKTIVVPGKLIGFVV